MKHESNAWEMASDLADRKRIAYSRLGTFHEKPSPNDGEVFVGYIKVRTGDPIIPVYGREYDEKVKST